MKFCVGRRSRAENTNENMFAFSFAFFFSFLEIKRKVSAFPEQHNKVVQSVYSAVGWKFRRGNN